MALNEKKGGIVGKDHFQDLVEALIQTWDLINFEPKKGRFTWSNNRIGATNIAARLDRYLGKISLMDGNVITSKILPKINFDHHPISLLLEKEEDLGPIPFRFSPLWIEREGFLDTMHIAWSHYIVGFPSFVLDQKVKKTKYALKNRIK